MRLTTLHLFFGCCRLSCLSADPLVLSRCAIAIDRAATPASFIGDLPGKGCFIRTRRVRASMADAGEVVERSNRPRVLGLGSAGVDFIALVDR